MLGRELAIKLFRVDMAHTRELSAGVKKDRGFPRNSWISARDRRARPLPESQFTGTPLSSAESVKFQPQERCLSRRHMRTTAGEPLYRRYKRVHPVYPRSSGR